MKAFGWLLLCGATLLAEEELPQRDGREPLEFEPSLQLYEVQPETTGPTVPWETPIEEEKARQSAEAAQRKAKRWQQLQKSGVVSKVEAECAAVQANRATLRYQQGRVATLRAQIQRLQQRAAKGEPTAEMIISAQSALRTAMQLTAEAGAIVKRTDLEFAKGNLERQRRLLAIGLGSKNQVKKAEESVRQLTVPAKR
jgi:multidrug resistance efflux pump